MCAIPQEDVPKKADVEEDSLEAETGRKRRDAEASAKEVPSYDPSVDINHFEAKGSYTLDLIGERRVSRHARSTEDYLQLPEAVESNLLAFINSSKHDIYFQYKKSIIIAHMIIHNTADYDLKRMKELRSELGDICRAPAMLHNDPDTVEAGKIKLIL